MRRRRREAGSMEPSDSLIMPVVVQYAQTNTHTYNHTHAHTHARTHPHTHAHTHTRTYTHTHTHTHTQTHTNTHRTRPSCDSRVPVRVRTNVLSKVPASQLPTREDAPNSARTSRALKSPITVLPTAVSGSRPICRTEVRDSRHCAQKNKSTTRYSCSSTSFPSLSLSLPPSLPFPSLSLTLSVWGNAHVTCCSLITGNGQSLPNPMY